MNRFVILAAAAALLAPSALGQKQGATNNNAPEIEQAIDLGSTGRVELTYTGITWAGGRWAKSLEDESRRDRLRARINGGAKSAPLGYFSTGNDVTVGGVRVNEGDYKLGFTLDDDFKWQITLFGTDAEIDIPLALMKVGEEEESKRLICTLYAGDEDFTGGIYIAFGDQMGSLDIKAAPTREEG